MRGLIRSVLALAVLVTGTWLGWSLWTGRPGGWHEAAKPPLKARPEMAVLEQLTRLDSHLAMPKTQGRPGTGGAPANPLLNVRSWGYQLQSLRLPELKAAPYDLLVIDYSRSGAEDRALTPAQIAQLKVKADGQRRIVLCYLSIGEAEDYRYYWDPGWRTKAPAWLGKQNPKWRGNYAVRYWQPEWQALMFGGEGSYLEKIVAMGFDGVYLDRIDSYAGMEAENPNAQNDMISFMQAIGQRGKTLKPGFLVVAQNAEELLEEPRFRAAIDGIAREDSIFGEQHEQTLNKESQISEVYGLLMRARADNKAVFVVDYIADPDIRSRVAQIALRRGFIPHFADRHLDRLSLHPLPGPTEKKGS